jgi:hypothetical protein
MAIFLKRILFLLPGIIFLYEFSFSQTEEIKSKPIVEIFSDFHVNLNKGESATSGFSLNRAWIGYDYSIDKNFYAEWILNIGSPDELGTGAKARRYAYFREASFSYKNDRLNITMGLTNTRLFGFQQKFYGKRYVANTFQAINGYGFDADLGAVVTYKLTNKVEADLMLMNGEGANNLQLDNNLKVSGGVTINPSHKTVIRFYADRMKLPGAWQNTLLAFAGYRSERFFIASEINYKANLDSINGHNGWGISSTGGITIFKKSEVFARYDYATSVIPTGDLIKWNAVKDNSFLIIGVQHAFSGSVKVAIDYQATFPEDKSKSASHFIFFNATFKI